MPKRHDQPPIEGEPDPELASALADMQGSEYHSYVIGLAPLVKGRTVAGSTGGNSGFIVELDDGTFVVSYLSESRLRWKNGSGRPTSADFALIASAQFGDASEPLLANTPYARERCDISKEVAQSHGERIATIAIGKDCFNLAFADGHELDTMVVTARDGRTALRVFWEQW